MASVEIRASVRFAWWVKPYLNACVLFAWLTGMEPDYDKVAAMISKGIKLNLSPEPFTAKG